MRSITNSLTITLQRMLDYAAAVLLLAFIGISEDLTGLGGMYRITFSEHYPEKPPRVRFTSDMFHPNVYR